MRNKCFYVKGNIIIVFVGVLDFGVKDMYVLLLSLHFEEQGSISAKEKISNISTYFNMTILSTTFFFGRGDLLISKTNSFLDFSLLLYTKWLFFDVFRSMRGTVTIKIENIYGSFQTPKWMSQEDSVYYFSAL